MACVQEIKFEPVMCEPVDKKVAFKASQVLELQLYKLCMKWIFVLTTIH